MLRYKLLSSGNVFIHLLTTFVHFNFWIFFSAKKIFKAKCLNNSISYPWNLICILYIFPKSFYQRVCTLSQTAQIPSDFNFRCSRPLWSWPFPTALLIFHYNSTDSCLLYYFIYWVLCPVSWRITQLTMTVMPKIQSKMFVYFMLKILSIDKKFTWIWA